MRKDDGECCAGRELVHVQYIVFQSFLLEESPWTKRANEPKKRMTAKRTNSHDNKEAGEEPPQVEHRRAASLDKVVRVGAPATDPVGQRREDVRGDDEERVVDLVEGAGEDDEEEAHGEDEGEGNDGLEAGGRHGG